MATHLCSSFQTLSLRQVSSAKMSSSMCKPTLSSSNLSCRRSTFGTGAQLQHQRPQAQQIQQNLQTVAGKLKTRKAAAKRFKITGSGKVIMRHSGKQHINEKKPAKRLSQLGKPEVVSDNDLPGIKGNLPYKRIVKSQNKIKKK